MKIRVCRADPSGNITLFVLDPVKRAERPALAEKLMGLPGTDVEQVGYLCQPEQGGDGRLEMAGGEFCGNATRAFGMLLAKEAGLSGRTHMQVEAGGCSRIVGVDIDLERGTARSEMPLPQLVHRIDRGEIHGTLVHLGGIAHLVVENIAPADSFFKQAEPIFEEYPELAAYGVIFLNNDKITPLVKVPAAHSLVWEGSCGSGTVAAAVAQSAGMINGDFARAYLQPSGSIMATITRQKGIVTAACIGGTVRLDATQSIEISY